MSSPKRILFVELLGGIGDLLIALKAIQALGRTHPDAELSVLCYPPGGELLEHDPYVHRTYHVENDEARLTLERVLAEHRFDLIVSDSVYEGIDQVIANSGAGQVVTNLWRRPPPDEHVGERFINILISEGLIVKTAVAPVELHLSPKERAIAQARFAATSGPLVFLIPDSGVVAKRWPVSSYIRLGEAMHYGYGATIMVSAANAKIGKAIVDGIGAGARLWPKGSLRDFAAALSAANLAVASDTGPARIAGSVGTPTITLFGPSWSGRYGQPLPHVNLQGDPDCSQRNISDFTLQPCWYSDCPRDQWQTCLEDITPEQVLTASETLLHRAGWGEAALGVAAQG